MVGGDPHRALVILQDVLDEGFVGVFAKDNANRRVLSL